MIIESEVEYQESFKVPKDKVASAKEPEEESKEVGDQSFSESVERKRKVCKEASQRLIQSNERASDSEGATPDHQDMEESKEEVWEDFEFPIGCQIDYSIKPLNTRVVTERPTATAGVRFARQKG